MIIILDNIFPQHVVDLIKNSLINLPITDTWYEKEDNFFIDDIIKISSKYFNLSEMIGYEMHKNITGPGFHQDKDEVLFSLKRIKSFPLCGIVYYPHIENMIGGELKFADATIKPINNRLVIFSPSLPHMVNSHKGTRISLGINPWKEKPLAYR